MKVRVVIDCDNAAFFLDPPHEVARILRSLASYLKDMGFSKEDAPVKLRDSNGNSVGTFEVIKQ